MGEVAEYALAVVGRYGHDAVACHRHAGIARLAAAAGKQAAAVEVDEHGQPLGKGLGGRPDVEVETVLAHLLRAEVHVAEEGFLHGIGAKLLGLAHALPMGGGLWGLPAQLSHGGSCKGNATENVDA